MHAPRDVPIEPDDLLDATDGPSRESPDGRRAWRESQRLRHDLLFPPAGLSVEGLDVVAALGRVAAAGGLLLATESRADRGAIRTRWRIMSRRDERAGDLHLARGGRDAAGNPRYDAAGRSVAEVLRDNEIAAGRFVVTDGCAARAPIVLGGTIRRAFTVPLVPGWLPTAELDNVAAPGRAAARDAARTPAQVAALAGDPNDDDWFRRHHARGRDYWAHRDAARLWVLNEDGGFAPATYNRHAPFDAYGPFSFHALLPAAQIDWFAARRPRPLRPLEDADRAANDAAGSDPPPSAIDGLPTPGGVRVEISFDGGVTWSDWPSRYDVLCGRAGIRFDADNPLEVAPPNAAPEIQNLWYALIDQTFRVRVTARFDSDRRLTVDGAARRSVLRGLRPAARLVDASRATAAGPRSHAVLAAMADDLADRGGGSSLVLTPLVPWIEPAWELGRRVRGVRGRGIDLGSQASPTTRSAVVVGRTFCFEAERFGTTLLLDVERLTDEEPLAPEALS